MLGVAPPLFVNVPPAPPSDHTAAVAPPPNEPPKAAVVPPWQMAAVAPPALTVDDRIYTVIVFDADAVPHEPPLVVSVKVPSCRSRCRCSISCLFPVYRRHYLQMYLLLPI